MARPLSGIRVIVVEDHADSRDILEQVLRLNGADVVGTATAREALSRVGDADIVVTDLALPEYDGLWLLEQVHRQPRPVPVVLLTGFAETQDGRLVGAPFALKLLKPVDPWAVSEAIAEIVQGGTRP